MHEEFDDLALLFASGELSGADRKRFEAHRPGCAACAGLLAALDAGSRFAEAAAVSWPDGRVEFIAEKILNEGSGEVPAARPGPFSRLLGASAAVGGLAVAIFVTTSMRPGLGPDPLWSRRMEGALSALDADIETLTESIELETTGTELESEFSAIEDASAWIDEQMQ